MIYYSSSPCRISFLGGGTDIPAWYINHQTGAVVSACLNLNNSVSIQRSEDLIIINNNDRKKKFRSISELKTCEEFYELYLILNYLRVEEPIDLKIRSNIPRHSGLGGSSAHLSALIKAIYKYKGKIITKSQLAEQNYFIERNILRVPGGKQDQYATAFGGVNKIIFSKNNNVSVERINVSENKLRKLENCLYLLKVNGTRVKYDIVQKTTNNLKKADYNTTTYYYQILNNIDKFISALKYGDLKLMGSLMTESFEKKIILNKDIVSNTNVIELFEWSLQYSYGSKLLGAGGGGYLGLIIKPAKINDFLVAAKERGFILINPKFSNSGTS